MSSVPIAPPGFQIDEPRGTLSAFSRHFRPWGLFMLDRRSWLTCTVAGVLTALSRVAAQSNNASAVLRDTVGNQERAFADTMAKRDFAAFSSFVSSEAIFFGGPDGNTAMRGRDAVLAGWKPLFEGPAAPFSWKPDVVEVLESGTLALTSGPVLDGKGQRTGRFNSVWRLEPDRRWRVVFDRGCPASRCS
jgi:ketosteroid isomerase-like protein